MEGTIHPTAFLGGLARKLVQANLLTEEKALAATTTSLQQGLPFISHIVNSKLIPPQTIAVLCSQEFGLPLFDASSLDPSVIPTETLYPALIQKHHMLPIFRRGNRLFIALSDPTNLKALDDFRYQSNLTTEAILTDEEKLSATIEKVLSAQEMTTLSRFDDAELETLEITTEEEANAAVALTGKEVDDAPIVRFINKILLDAINVGASDLHFEPYEKTCRVRIRQDGILREYATPPVTLAPRLAARLKIMSRLDISERRIPQDGRFKMKLSSSRSIDFRVSTCPTLFGEKVAIRILDPANVKLGIDALGFEPFQKEAFLKAIQRPQGMILVTGPTGSGKTVTLYSAMHILNTTEDNVSTCEDPVEINLPGVNQVHVNPKAGLTFAVALRAFLRQDPDVIMVGEIRDLETAEIAIQAAQTGHLVLSTLHTNSAPETLTRLISMGIPPYNLATSVVMVVSQRLARCLCPHCKVAQNLPKEVLLQAGFREEELSTFVLYGPHGCEQCQDGYKGRTGIYEVMPISDDISRIIMSGGNALALAEQAKKEKVWFLRQSALNKLKMGATSLEEINRVTMDNVDYT